MRRISRTCTHERLERHTFNAIESDDPADILPPLEPYEPPRSVFVEPTCDFGMPLILLLFLVLRIRSGSHVGFGTR